MTKPFILFIAFALAVGSAFGGVFAGGVAFGKTQNGEAPLQEANSVRQEFGNRSHQGSLTGVIEEVDGNIVSVNTSQGMVTATLKVDTKIRRFADGNLSDLQPGMRVTLVGEPGVDGAVEARSVLLNPEDAYGFFSAGFFANDRQQRGQSEIITNFSGRESQEHSPNPGGFFFGGGQQHGSSSVGGGGSPVHP